MSNRKTKLSTQEIGEREKLTMDLAQKSVVARRAAIERGEDQLPMISRGTGLTVRERPAKPNELSQSQASLTGISEDYHKAKWAPGEIEDKSMKKAANWAELNDGPQKNDYQHRHWYADQILQRLKSHQKHSFAIDPSDPDMDKFFSNLDQASQAIFEVACLYTDALWKFEYEHAAIEGRNMAKKRGIGAKRGGVATKTAAEKRRQEFNSIALANIKDWVPFSETQQIKVLKNMMRQHKCFIQTNGNLLSDRWFKERLSDLKGTGEMAKALK